MKLKYIIVDGCIPIVFTECHKHDEIANGREVESAGFCRAFVSCEESEGSEYIKVVVWGESISLKVSFDPTDASILEKMFNEN